MNTEVPPIFHLNDDCLWCIFSYLDLPELLIAGSVCQRFEAIAQMFYKNNKNCQSLDYDQLTYKFRLKDIRPPGLGEVFRQLEPHMIALKIRDFSYKETFGHAGFPISSFANLQHLWLFLNEIHEEYANIFPALKQIVLKNLNLLNQDVLKKWFKNSPHLKILKFSKIHGMTGKFLVSLKGIEELKIEITEELKEKYFEKFCQMNPQLKKLAIELCEIGKRSNTFLKIITKYLRNLESLVIRNYTDKGRVNYELLRDLPTVTKLHLNIVHTHQSYEYYHLIEYFGTNNHIEYLNLEYLTEGVLRRLQQFPYLKVLKLRHYGSLKFERFFNFICCSATLEELHLGNCHFESSARLKEFIQQFQTLKLLNVCRSWDFKSSFLIDFEVCLQGRSQMLEIAVTGTPLAQELQMEPKSDVLKNFLDRTKDKLKLTIDAFREDGMPKKSFHEWEEWEGEWEGEW